MKKFPKTLQKTDLLAEEFLNKKLGVTSVLLCGLIILCLAAYGIDFSGYEHIFSNPSDANELLQQRWFQDNWVPSRQLLGDALVLGVYSIWYCVLPAFLACVGVRLVVCRLSKWRETVLFIVGAVAILLPSFLISLAIGGDIWPLPSYISFAYLVCPSLSICLVAVTEFLRQNFEKVAGIRLQTLCWLLIVALLPLYILVIPGEAKNYIYQTQSADMVQCLHFPVDEKVTLEESLKPGSESDETSDKHKVVRVNILSSGESFNGGEASVIDLSVEEKSIGNIRRVQIPERKGQYRVIPRPCMIPDPKTRILVPKETYRNIIPGVDCGTFTACLPLRSQE